MKDRPPPGRRGSKSPGRPPRGGSKPSGKPPQRNRGVKPPRVAGDGASKAGPGARPSVGPGPGPGPSPGFNVPRPGPLAGRAGRPPSKVGRFGASAGRGYGARPKPFVAEGRRAGYDPGQSLARAGVRFVFEDADVIVVEKPAGLLSASPGNAEPFNLFRLLKRYTQQTGGPGGSPLARRSRRDERDLRAAHEVDPGPDAMGVAGVRGPMGEGGTGGAGGAGIGRDGLGLIHRLDREASGLMVFSKTGRAFHWLKDDFKTKKSHRLYTVLVCGVLGQPGASGTIQSLLKEYADGRVASIAAEQFRGSIGPARAGDEEPARPATTHYKVIAAGNGYSLLQVRLDTGRKHQIRVHLSERGHPVAGDRRYGAPADPLGRLGLHASELGFRHPGTGQSARYVADAPPEFYKAVGAKPPPARAAAPAASPIAGPGTAAAASTPGDTSWEGVAGWYDELITSKRSDHYDQVIIPGMLRLAQPQPGTRVLDVACGQGVMTRAIAAVGVSAVGVDASASLVEAARAHAAEGAAGPGGQPEYLVGDARLLAGPGLDPATFDGAVCVMGLANIDPLAPLMARVAELLKPGGWLAWVITHPAFRAAGQTDWGWDAARGRQFRRVEGYLSTGQKAIQMHPGAAPEITTWTFHRPLQHYVHAMAQAGLLVSALEEWPAVRTSQPGPRAAEENRARAEIPLFLAVRAVRALRP